MPCNSTAAWATFALATFLGVANIASPFFPMLLVGFCSSAIGMLLGWLVRSQKLNGKVPVIGLFLLLVILYVKLKTLNGSFFRPVLILDIPVAVQGYGFYFKGFLTRNLHLFQAFFGSFWTGKGFFFSLKIQIGCLHSFIRAFKLKITCQVDENKISSKTLSNRNVEATNPPCNKTLHRRK